MENMEARRRMNVRLKPLGDKYYGTIVEILDGPLEDCEIKVWVAPDDWDDPLIQPSDRELELANMTRGAYEKGSYEDRCAVDTGGGHYENRASFKVAEAIVKALTELTLEES
jgi:hypothetical protein